MAGVGRGGAADSIVVSDETLILGIETSCDETAAAVVRGGREVLSNVIASQHELHAEYRGVVPEIASRAHAERVVPIVTAALREAGVELHDLTAVAVGNRPGLIGSLLVGVAAAKALAWALGIPIIGVDHVHAHLYAGLLNRAAGDSLDATYPALGLVVSGGHTAMYACESPTRVRRIGATIDDALGEAYDKVAAILDLGYPGGPAVDRLASSDGAMDDAHDLPISRLGRESLDFSFSGLKTAVLYAARGVPGRDGSYPREAGSLTPDERRDLAASFQRAAADAMLLKLRRAIASEPARPGPLLGTSPLRGGRESNKPITTPAPPPYRSLLIGGGVSSNSRLRAALTSFAADAGLALFLPPPAFCVDNAAMIAGLGHQLLLEGAVADWRLQASPTTGA
jgi:N6-L-threonylcarbamoyladenine synthase